MRRREFIKSTAIAGAGLTLGLPNMLLDAWPGPELKYSHSVPLGIRYPHGGCTESSVASFDRGPFGKDPFGFFN